MRIGLFSDHGGFTLKEELLSLFNESYNLQDFGTFTSDSVDYPTFANHAAEAIQNQIIDRAVLICRTGVGMAIAANRFPWIRAFVAHSIEETHFARAHNDVNIICFPARLPIDYKTLFTTFMETPFEGGRHQNRINMFSNSGK